MVIFGQSCFSPERFTLPGDELISMSPRFTGDPMTWDRHYSDHPSRYISPRSVIEPGLTVCQASMLPTWPPVDPSHKEKSAQPSIAVNITIAFLLVSLSLLFKLLIFRVYINHVFCIMYCCVMLIKIMVLITFYYICLAFSKLCTRE